MADHAVFPARVRRRLTVAFVLVAALAAGTLAVGSYVLVRESREQRFDERSIRQAQTSLDLIDLGLVAEDTRQVLAAHRRGLGYEVLVVSDGEVRSSLPDLTVSDVPAALRDRVSPTALTSDDLTFGGTPYLVVAGAVEGTDTVLYYLFDRSDLLATVDELRNVLLVGWLLVTLSAAAVGNAVARRTLRPVREASSAAHAMAQGVLDTRLDEDRGDEFGAWARDFNDMAEALEQKITALSEATERERRFTADVAHELRTPLGSVVAAATLLEEDLSSLPIEAQRPLEVLIAELRRLRHLVDDLLELSRLDSGQEVVQHDAVRLDHLLAAVVQAYGDHTPIAVVAAPCEVVTDGRRVERVVGNLVVNAVHHGRPPVEVVLDQVGTTVVVEVRDHGPGIPPEELGHIFDRFSKLDHARSSGGSGLGLAIARENAELLGGSLEAASLGHTGTAFRLTLPGATEPSGGEPSTSSRMTQPVRTAVGSGGAAPG